MEGNILIVDNNTYDKMKKHVEEVKDCFGDEYCYIRLAYRTIDFKDISDIKEIVVFEDLQTDAYGKLINLAKQEHCNVVILVDQERWDLT